MRRLLPLVAVAPQHAVGGERRCSIYHPALGAWAPAGSLNLDPAGEPDSGGRWYPLLVTLPDGQVLAAGGHPDLREEREIIGWPRFAWRSKEWPMVGAVDAAATRFLHARRSGRICARAPPAP
jgi:hypothetical protein